MAGKSDYLENKILDHVLKNTSYSSPAAVYMALFSAAPNDAGGGTEVSGGSYARTAITFAAAASGATSNSGAVTFPTASADWASAADLTHFGIFDASTVGNLLYWGALTDPKPVQNGDTASFAIGEIDVTED